MMDLSKRLSLSRYFRFNNARCPEDGRRPASHAGPGLPSDARLDDLDMPERIRQPLLRAGLKTVGDVRSATDDELYQILTLGLNAVPYLRLNLGSAAGGKDATATAAEPD
jgi:hypothetical protein